MSRRHAWLWTEPLGGGGGAVVLSVSFGVVDTAGGGQRVAVEVDSSATCTDIAAGGVAFTDFAIDDGTHVSGVPGARAAGIVDVVVTNATGPSSGGTGLIEYWYPGTEASCTLLVERPDYDAGTGTWTARVGSDFTSPVSSPTASGGAPVFTGGTDYLRSVANFDTLVGATDGTIFSVQSPTSENNPEDSPVYVNKGIWTKLNSGPIGLWNATDGVDQWYGFSEFDGSTYVPVRSNVASLTGGRHATVGTFSASSMSLSVNGSALASASTATAGSPTTPYGANPIDLGGDYSGGGNGFTGSMRVFAVFNVEADDALSTKCYEWARQRHGVGLVSFDPLSVGTPKLWYDLAHQTNGSGIVTAIPDMSGNGNDAIVPVGFEPQFTAANAAFNNLPTMDFVPTTDLRYVDTPALGIASGPFTYAIVCSVDPSGDYVMAAQSTSGSIYQPGGPLEMSGDGGGNNISAGTPPAVVVVVAVFDGVSSRFYVNAKTAVTGNGGAENLGGLGVRLGMYGAGQLAVWSQGGSTAHALVYDGALSQGDVEYLLDGFGALAGVGIAP